MCLTMRSGFSSHVASCRSLANEYTPAAPNVDIDRLKGEYVRAGQATKEEEQPAGRRRIHLDVFGKSNRAKHLILSNKLLSSRQICDPDWLSHGHHAPCCAGSRAGRVADVMQEISSSPSPRIGGSIITARAAPHCIRLTEAPQSEGIALGDCLPCMYVSKTWQICTS